jgi:hypothetical protein
MWTQDISFHLHKLMDVDTKEDALTCGLMEGAYY